MTGEWLILPGKNEKSLSPESNTSGSWTAFPGSFVKVVFEIVPGKSASVFAEESNTSGIQIACMGSLATEAARIPLGSREDVFASRSTNLEAFVFCCWLGSSVLCGFVVSVIANRPDIRKKY